jgi:hypothetical protein
MKKLALSVAIGALAACGQSQPEQPIQQAAAAEPAPVPTGQLVPGIYSVTEIDGTKMTEVLATDHTYTETVHGQKIEAGAWALVGGRTCLTPSEGAGAQARCYTDSPLAADGTFTATPDRGDPMTVRKIA